ncbi:hypothetical protein INT48_000500 [Thamnidium elegans]|uniref:OTU domain-containing protein n=1 Tax=Thamnidium elegans TaxID=101142 RepID=A0A8H7SV05_9FUNG|nr:hypothetical protein INT48_000500 [Thamnidium elegans]
MGLSTKNITGDGNCLFRALSDQYYGHDSNHKSIRQEICQFLKDNEEDYKFFVEDDQSFEHHIQCMSQNATYGGNMELAAFAKMKEVDIKVYQPDVINSYVINGKNEEDDTAQVLHIAYHSWEHYSSVRNINGPYSGPPEINVTKVEGPTSPEEEGSEGEEEGLSSKEKVVLIACPGTNIRKIRRLLIKYKGDPDKVIDALYDPKPNGTDTPADAVQETKDSGDIDKVDNVGDIDKQEDLEEKDVDQGKEQVVEKKDNVQQDQVADQDTASTKEVPLITETIAPTDTKEAEKKPKKLTTRERKEQAKKRQKEAKLEKDRAKAARRSKYKQEKEDDPDATKSECISKVATAMKEMYI